MAVTLLKRAACLQRIYMSLIILSDSCNRAGHTNVRCLSHAALRGADAHYRTYWRPAARSLQFSRGPSLFTNYLAADRIIWLLNRRTPFFRPTFWSAVHF